MSGPPIFTAFHSGTARRNPDRLAIGAAACASFLLFYALQTVRALKISFTGWNLLREPAFVGIDNYAAPLAAFILISECAW